MRARLCLVLALVAPLACQSASMSGPSNGDKPDPSTCDQCHMDDFNATTRPMHPGKKPTKCGVCHTQESWHPSRLAHAWTLDGAHAKLDCFECHKGEPTVFHGTDKACLSCHREDEHTANRELAWHEAEGSRCLDCHTTSAWKPPAPEYHETPHPPPSATPSAVPSAVPSALPSAVPTVKPHPTVRPHPTVKPIPTTVPTTVPTVDPTVDPPDIIGGPSRRR